MVTLRYVQPFHYFVYGSSWFSSVPINKFWTIIPNIGHDSYLLHHFQLINLRPHDGINEESGVRKS